jgi:hypothetical protein
MDVTLGTEAMAKPSDLTILTYILTLPLLLIEKETRLNELFPWSYIMIFRTGTSWDTDKSTTDEFKG